MRSEYIVILSFAGLLFVTVIFRTVFIYKPLPLPKSCLDSVDHKRIKLTEEILNRFKGALDIRTISFKKGHIEPENLLKLINFIESSYPQIHNASFIKRELISNYSLLYTIEGTDKSLRPYVLTSHLDVVPTVDSKWTVDPFNTTIEEGYIYARGTIDAKHLLIAILETVETMLKNGFIPRRSFYLIFGHDEEISGLDGAQQIAKLLEQRVKPRWGKLEYILDEGTCLIKKKILGLEAELGIIGVVEKGYLTVKVSTTGEAGHGSMPSRQTVISKLALAIGRFHSHVSPSFFGKGIEREMFDEFARYARWPYKIFYANLWLFKPIFEYVFSSEPLLNSLIRTSTAVTIFNGGTKDNILPDTATAYINHRIHPSQTVNEILEFDRRIINDPDITVEATGNPTNPTPIAPYCEDCFPYQLIKQSALQVYPGTVLVPGTFLAASDSRHYTNLTDAIYKFTAISVDLAEMNRFHGHDERLSLKNFENLINFYHHLIKNSDETKLKLRPEPKDEL